MTIEPRDLEDRWSAARAAPVRRAFRTATIDVATPQGEILVALDVDDRRHLLVPIASQHTLRQDESDGRAVLLRRRVLEDAESYQTYATLELDDDTFEDLFTTLCGEVVERIAETPDRAVAAMRRALHDWRALLAGRRRLLGPAELVGLFGELMLLRRLLVIDNGAASSWGGPDGAAHDFQRGGDAIEVKTTTAQDGRQIRVHGLGQMDVAAPGRLWLHWTRLRDDQGVTVPELVDDVLALTDDPVATTRALLSAGYDHRERDAYGVRRFEPLEERTYLVADGFPRITASGLTGDAALGGIGPVEYVLDLDNAAADRARTEVDVVDQFLGAS